MPKHFPRSSDEYILKMMYLKDHERMTNAEISERYGITRNAVSGIIGRIRDTFKGDNGIGNGTMPHDWWKK